MNSLELGKFVVCDCASLAIDEAQGTNICQIWIPRIKKIEGGFEILAKTMNVMGAETIFDFVQVLDILARGELKESETGYRPVKLFMPFSSFVDWRETAELVDLSKGKERGSFEGFTVEDAQQIYDEFTKSLLIMRGFQYKVRTSLSVASSLNKLSNISEETGFSVHKLKLFMNGATRQTPKDVVLLRRALRGMPIQYTVLSKFRYEN